MQENQQLYSKFVERLGDTNYLKLIQISRQEGLLNIFLEEGSISKNIIQDHIKNRSNTYHPKNLSLTPLAKRPPTNLSPKQIEFKKIFLMEPRKNPRSTSTGLEQLYKTIAKPQDNSRRISDASFLETSFQCHPSFGKQKVFPDHIISPIYVEQNSRTMSITRQKPVKSTERINRKNQSMSVQPVKKVLKKLHHEHIMDYKMDFNESLIGQIKQLLMNMTGLNYKSYFYITLEQLKRFLVKRFPANMVDKLCEFLEFPSKMDLTQYVDLISSINMWNSVDIYFLAFYMMDFNSDGVICPQDIFKLYKQKDNEAALADFNILAKVMSLKLRQEEKAFERPVYPELYYVTQLTCTIYFRLSRKMKVKTIKTSCKKDTVYHMGFLGLSHKPEQRIKNQEDEKLMKDPCTKKFNYYGEFQPSQLGEIFENIELCSLNFTTFKEIFASQLPNFLHDILFCLTLYRFPDATYQYDVQNLLDISLK